MIVDVVMPKMGESITEGTILEWHKQVGDTIAVDEILLEIGTDKVDSEIPSPNSGLLKEILATPNDVVEVGKVIARIDTEETGAVTASQETNQVAEPEKTAILESVVEQPKAVKPQPASPPAPKPGTKRYYTPLVKSIARKKNVSEADLTAIAGTGKNGRVTKKDILNYLEARQQLDVPTPISEAPTPLVSTIPTAGDERVAMDNMRRIIAEHMRASLDTSAHVHLMGEVDMTHIVRFVEQHGASFSAQEGFSLTYTPFIVAATVRALQSFPDMNSALEDNTIIRNKNINIGLAVAVERGLLVPVISHCEELNFLGFCRKIRDLANRARNNRIHPDELSGSTFSISNFGVFNVSMGTPIINQPNVGILGVGTIKKKPVVLETDQGDTIAIRSMMYLSIGFDHRLIDGAGGARFLDILQHNLEGMNLEQLL